MSKMREVLSLLAFCLVVGARSAGEQWWAYLKVECLLNDHFLNIRILFIFTGLEGPAAGRRGRPHPKLELPRGGRELCEGGRVPLCGRTLEEGRVEAILRRLAHLVQVRTMKEFRGGR